MSGLVLGLIPARGGSQGIPGKNLRCLAGKPLLQYAIEAGRAAGVLDRLVLSTDSDEIATLGRRLGVEVPFMRPASLALDTTPMAPVIAHAVETLAESGWMADVIVLLQPTAPLRRPEHIRAAVALLNETGSDSVASVIELPPTHSPDYVMRIEQGRLVPFLPERPIGRRQDARPAYTRDGTVYVFRREVIAGGDLYGSDCRPLLVPGSESITLDSPSDWSDAERLLTQA